MLKSDEQLIESELFKGFYHCPLFETLVISKDGYVVDQRNLVCLLPFLREHFWPYFQINVWGHGTQTLHRLIAMTFNVCPGNYDECVVNHIDGDKLNNHPSNLEWVTSSENAFHAYREGLRADNRPLLAKDLVSDKVQYFYSLQEAARYFQVNGSEVYRYLTSDSLVPWKSRYELIYEDSSWRGLTQLDVGKKANGQSREVVVTTNEVVYLFSSIADAARFLQLSNSKVYSLLTGSACMPGVEICYLEEYGGDTDSCQVMPSHRKSVIRPNFKRIPRRVRVLDKSTGLVTEWESVQAFAHSVGVGKSTIQKSMNSNVGAWQNFHLSYL